MQPPTLKRVQIRGLHDAEMILHAVYLGRIPMVRRRLDDEDRLALKPGNVYVWEERSNNPMEASSLDSIQRFTDGRSWGPSKARDDFLLYFEKESPNNRTAMLHRQNNSPYVQLVKQTFSAYVDGPANTRKWHINAYYTYDRGEGLMHIDQLPQFQDIVVPKGKYTSSRASGQRKNCRKKSSDDDMGPIPPPLRSSSSSPHSDESPTYEGTLSFPTDEVSYRYPPVNPRVPQRRTPYPPPLPPQDDHFAQQQSSRSVVRLAPLEYLQNVAPVAREPADDRALRSFGGFS